MEKLQRLKTTVDFALDHDNPDYLFKEGNDARCCLLFKPRNLCIILSVITLYHILILIGVMVQYFTGDPVSLCPFLNTSMNHQSCVDTKSSYSYGLCLSVWLYGSCTFGFALPLILFVSLSLYLIIVPFIAAYEIWLALKPTHLINLHNDDVEIEDYPCLIQPILSSYPRIRFMFNANNPDNLCYVIKPDDPASVECRAIWFEKYKIKLGVTLLANNIFYTLLTGTFALALFVWYWLGVFISNKMMETPLYWCTYNTTTNDMLPGCLMTGIFVFFLGLACLFPIVMVSKCIANFKHSLKPADEIPLIKTRHRAEVATYNSL